MMQKIIITILGYSAAFDLDLGECDCNGVSDLQVISGQIWPAWGQVSINDDGESMITPPANCTGTTCGRANVTCTIETSSAENVEWQWTWVPKVQYPRGNKSRQPDELEYLPSFADVQKSINNEFDNCPTFYYEYYDEEKQLQSVKTCPQNYNTFTTSTSVLIIYNYINEQDDGIYTCIPNMKTTDNLVTCCNQTVYYASPKWNGACWTGMIYSMGFTVIFLYFLSTNVLASSGEKQK